MTMPSRQPAFALPVRSSSRRWASRAPPCSTRVRPAIRGASAWAIWPWLWLVGQFLSRAVPRRPPAPSTHHNPATSIDLQFAAAASAWRLRQHGGRTRIDDELTMQRESSTPRPDWQGNSSTRLQLLSPWTAGLLERAGLLRLHVRRDRRARSGDRDAARDVPRGGRAHRRRTSCFERCASRRRTAITSPRVAARDPTLFGRFDLAYDGSGPPKLLEYNADTPTALLEAAVIQWYWLKDVKPGRRPVQLDPRAADRRLGASCDGAIPTEPVVHFAGVLDDSRGSRTLEYLRDTALQAGLDRAARSSCADRLERQALHRSRRAADPGAVQALPVGMDAPREFGAHLLTDTHRLDRAAVEDAAVRTRRSCRCCGSCSRTTRTCCRPSIERADRRRAPT